MLRNYWKTAIRNFTHNKFYTGVNIVGLAIGLAVGIMILLWVTDEYSFDGFHRNAPKIYYVNSRLGSGSGAQVWPTSPGPLAVFAKKSVPEVISTVRILAGYLQPQMTYADKKYVEKQTAYVDPSFFSIFDFGLLRGNPARPFLDNNSIVITESTAKKYFGDEDPIGKTLLADHKDNFRVTGVIKDIPGNSTIRYDILFPMSLYAKNFGGNEGWKTIDEDLGDFPFHTYMLLRDDASPRTVEKKLTKIYDDIRVNDGDAKNTSFALQPLLSLHLVTADGNRSALQTVRIFFLVALLILVIACINYVNLSTARSAVRAKEVSVRKIIGAGKGQLFIQFIIESTLLFLIASLLAFLIIYLLLPQYNELSGKHLLLSLADPKIWLVIGSAILGTLALGSIYPALLLSSFKPVEALKGKLSLGMKTTSFRKILVVTQFVFSIGLVIGTLVIGTQLRYIREKDLGFDREQVFSFWMNKNIHDHFAAVRRDLQQQPGILDIASADNGIVGSPNTTGDTWWEGKVPNSTFLIHPNGIDNDLIPLLKMHMVAGRNFSGVPSDSAHLILNETAVRQAGIKDPIGKSFQLWQTKGTIIGVVKDFNYSSLKSSIEPVAFYYDKPGWLALIKTTGRDAPNAIAAARRLWTNYASDLPFSYTFLDDDFERLHESDQRMGTLFNIFSMVAIVISCLGLFSLVTYTAELKKKEIGIRKVLGANIWRITRLLTTEFLGLVCIAFLFAAPLAWYTMHKWLQDFIYRIGIGWWIFALAGLGALAIALLTVSFQAIRAAMANPVRSLRSE
jgi:putative ABC transport system permease protein